jgi:hypothetical protein
VGVPQKTEINQPNPIVNSVKCRAVTVSREKSLVAGDRKLVPQYGVGNVLNTRLIGISVASFKMCIEFTVGCEVSHITNAMEKLYGIESLTSF